MIDFLDEITWRGLLHQCTDEDGLRAHLAAATRRAYAGFDPTADSLTIGNLVPMMMLVHLARAGHEPVVVMGGGTGLIGDPSGKSAERQLMTEDQVRAHVDAQRPIFEKLFDHADVGAPRIENNLDWLGALKYVDLLRDVGKHFSVNMMIQKESVKERLHNREQGISYTEFSYMILQAYDFAHLHNQGVTIQLGGSDQWGNIVAGADLIRRTAEHEDVTEKTEQGQMRIVHHPPPAFGLTCPLVTKADGGKFGKTESGAVWLSAPRTTPYAMFQFWLNTADEDVIRFLKLFTLLDHEDIRALEVSLATDPAKREPQRALAEHATDLVHGKPERENAERAARALFSGDIADLPLDTLNDLFAEVPSSEHPRATLEAGVPLVDLLVDTGLAQSKRQAREFLQNGSVSVNGRKVGLEDQLGTTDLLHGQMVALRRGKKSWHATRWV